MSSKTGQEARVERITWFALCMVCIIMYFDDQQLLPTFLIPFLVAIILIFSGVYQYRRGWRVSPVLWGASAILLALGSWGVAAGMEVGGFIVPPAFGLRLISLVAVIVIIVFGIITNEG